MPITPLVARYDHILLDLDGCVWVGDEPTPGAVDAIAALRAAGKDVAFVTNDTQLATEEYVRKLWRLGFQASLEEVVTAGGALQFVLAERFDGGVGGRHRLARGPPPRRGGRAADRQQHGVRQPRRRRRRRRFTRGFDYAELRDATQAALRGAYLLGSNRDATFPMPDGLWPGSGAMLAAVETASGRTVRDRRQARADARADGARPARPRPGADGRRPRRRRPRRGARRRHRRRDRADRRVGPRDAPRRRRDPRPVAIAERLETLVLGTDDPRARRSPSPAPRGRCRGAAGAAGRACPASCSCAWSRSAMARLAGAPARRQRGDLGDQRQDDDRRDGRGDPRGRRARASCTTAPARTWRAASRPRCSAPRAAAAIDGDAGLFEVDEFWLDQVVPELRPRALLLSNLFRDQLDRYGELETIADRWAAAVAAAPGHAARAERRRPARRRPRARSRRA